MNDLLQHVIDTYGGLDRWNGYRELTARVRGGGVLWTLKQQEGVLDDYTTRIELHRQYAAHAFAGPGLLSVYTPDRVAVEKETGEVVEERTDPRAAFAGHEFTTPWDRLHLAYFTGYAMWTYLTEPFSLAAPGTVTEEIEPWQEDGETWRRLKVLLAPELTGHSRENVYYIDADGLIRRHDYFAEVLGTGVTRAAHMISGHREYDGIVVPAERRVWRIGEGNKPNKDVLSVSIDVSDVSFR
ncbi:hypothetical protein OG552_28050 [Streptomyces sp. NBC_01476]|uniref:hypothetical protein n=1 Tax=Streptomyces sp. NBC_01476 TaxID=2903881 RepID=UPI002E34621E|nr:hypothetical protein [Streptomyces sp. NBC_01476]